MNFDRFNWCNQLIIFQKIFVPQFLFRLFTSSAKNSFQNVYDVFNRGLALIGFRTAGTRPQLFNGRYLYPVDNSLSDSFNLCKDFSISSCTSEYAHTSLGAYGNLGQRLT